MLKYEKSLIIALLLLLTTSFSEPNVKVITIEKIVVAEVDNSFSEEKLKQEILSLNFKFPNIVYAQAILESGGFKSKIFLENNNLFGLKKAGSRITTAVRTQRAHAYYDNWKMSLIDRSFYEAAYLKGMNKKQYLAYLNRNYAEVNDYDVIIQNLIKKQQINLL